MERDIEAYVRDNVPGKLIKFVSPGNAGVPDRIYLGEQGEVIFIEFKQPGGRLSPKQRYWLNKLINMGHQAIIIENMREAKEFVQSARVPKENNRSDRHG